MRFSLESTAPVQVELTLFRLDNALQVNAVALSNETVSPTVPGFEIRVKMEKAPGQVLLMPGKKPLPFRYEDGYAVFEAQSLHIFDMYQIEF